MVVRYRAASVFASLIQVLEDQGVDVHLQPVVEEREGVVEFLVIPFTVTGAHAAVKAGVAMFGQRFPNTRVEAGGRPSCEDGHSAERPRVLERR